VSIDFIRHIAIISLLLGFLNSLEAQTDTIETVPITVTDSIASIDSIGIADTLLVKDSTMIYDSISKEQDIKDTTKRQKGNVLLESKVDYDSFDTIVSFMNERRIILRGNAKVFYENIELTADHIEIDFKNNELFAKGRTDSLGMPIGFPVFKEGSEIYESRELRYNFKTQKGIITDVITEQDGGFLHSKRTKKHNNNIIDLKAGKFTTCDHEHPHYYIAMSKARVIQDDKIISGPLYLVIKDVPTPFAIPFGFFPFTQEQASGIIIPSYGESEKRGFSLENLGYYFALNDYLDLRVMASLYSYGSIKGDIATRYKKRYRFGGDVRFMYERIIESEEGLADYINTTAYTFQWQHRQDPKARPNSNFSANVNLKSTSANRYSTNMDNYLQSTVNSSINYSHNLPGTPFSFNAQLRHTLNTRDSSVTMTLPSVNLNMKRITPFESKKSNKKANIISKIGITYKSRFENRFTVHEKDLFKPEVVDQFKFGIKHDVGVSTSAKFLKFFNFSPSTNYSERWYFNSIRKQYSDNIFISGGDTIYGKTIEDTITGFNRVYDYSTGAQINTTIYGMFMFKPFMPIEAIRIVHTPSIGYSYKPDFSLDRYGYYDYVDGNPDQTYSYYQNGIYGVPGGPESSAVTFSLSNQVGMKIRTPKDTASQTKKIDLLKQLSFNTNYNLVADSLNWSPLSMRASTNLFQKININASATLDPYALDPVTFKKIDHFQYHVDGKLGRLTNARITVGFSIDSKLFEGDEVDEDKKKPEDYNYYDYFDIPWSLKIDYTWGYSKPLDEKTVTQTVAFSGDFSITQNWKIGFRSGYDFENRKMSATTFNITRDLHCWIMSFRWIPFGERQSYFFTIGVKSSMLQDLKYDKRNHWYDNQ
jgi:lipopolysaccharide assembly outer membrane protein LptD (OstA)